MVFKKSSKLRKSRFEKLVIHLSINDIFFLVEANIYVLLKEFDTGLDKIYNYTCLSVINVTAGKYIFVLFQGFLLCLERLNATFAVEVTAFRGITSNKGVIGCIVCHLTSVLQTVIEIFLFQTYLSTCDTSASAINTTLFMHSIPEAFLCICTVVTYVAIFVRIYMRQHIHPSKTMMEQLMIKALKTLSIVMSITLIANAPSCIMGFYAEFYGRSEHIINWIYYCNILTMIHLLIDPIIYVFRLQDFRDQIANVLCRKHD
ncbi:unnamed protein product [Mytilus coruscus]|uniref:G-protein coupled receptors family 1 profile domain-containing protein n=1 Tax=Mytilus coruscus TaxID=42192 RepID=A0A6J8CNQ1_MYTCO|nr:unnamed protein product [Mytilus coruscus]